MKTVEIPGIGSIDFPDTMGDEEISAAIKQIVAEAPSAQATDDVGAARQRLQRQGGGLTDQISAGLSGANLSLADILGAPMSAVNNLPRTMNLLPGVEGVQPFNLPGDAGDMRSLMQRGGFSTVEDVRDLPEDQRAAGRAGEAFGNVAASAIPMLGLGRVPLAASRAGPPGIWQGIRETAARNPGQFAAQEAAMAGGSAQAAGLAELFLPGNEAVGTAAEIGGAILSPTALAARMGRRAVSGAQRAGESLTPAGRQRSAARELDRMLVESGEDPQQIIRALEEPDADGFSLAERSQSPVLLGIRQRAMREDPNLARRVEAGDQQALTRLTTRMREMIDPGDAGALTRTAQGQADRIDQNVLAVQRRADEMVNDAITRAQATAARFEGTGQQSRVNASLAARDTLERAYGNARSVERNLWDQIPKATPVNPQNTIATRARLMDEESLRMEDLPGPVQRELRRIEDDLMRGEVPDANRMLKLRSQLLEMARSARGGQTPDRTLGRIYSDLAEGILDDLGTLPGAAPAREFSRRLHDGFTRTFAGEPLRTRATGAQAVAPEQTLDRAFAGNPAARDANMRDLTRATEPMPFRGGRTRDLSPDMQAAQEQFIRAEVAKLFDPNMGTVRAPQAEAFLRDNAPLLERFPRIRDDLTRAVQTGRAVPEAQDTAKALRGRAEDLSKRAREEGAFQRVLDAGEQPSRAVAKALSGPNPVRDMQRLASLARRGGEEAVAGLRAATFDLVKAQATRGDTLDFVALTRTLAQPLVPDGPNLMQTLRQSGVLSTTHAARVQQAIQKGLRHQTAVARDVNVSDEVGDAWDMLLRLGGANIGGAMATGRGAPLVAAGAGSRLARKLGERVPQQKVKEVLFKALEDEELLRTLLSRTEGAPAARRVEQQLFGPALWPVIEEAISE